MKFLVVDDHALIREAMRGVLKELQGDALVLDAASSDQAMDVDAAASRPRSRPAGSQIA